MAAISIPLTLEGIPDTYVQDTKTPRNVLCTTFVCKHLGKLPAQITLHLDSKPFVGAEKVIVLRNQWTQDLSSWVWRPYNSRVWRSTYKGLHAHLQQVFSEENLRIEQELELYYNITVDG